jgi:hypothetical protein
MVNTFHLHNWGNSLDIFESPLLTDHFRPSSISLNHINYNNLRFLRVL